MRTLLILLTVWSHAWTPGWATTVRAPSFEELVDGSALVFRGRVESVQNVWSGEDANRHLATRVVFVVETVLKGSPGGPLTLEFMGGERDGKRFDVEGMPRFAVGERGVFFVERSENRFCPIRRLRHGRYRIQPDATRGADHVVRDDHSPLRTPEAVREPLNERPRAAATQPGETMTLAAFEQAIVTRAAAAGTPIPSR